MLYSQHFTFHWKLLVYNVDTSLGGAGANLQTVFLVLLGSVKVSGRGKGKQENVLLSLASQRMTGMTACSQVREGVTSRDSNETLLRG